MTDVFVVIGTVGEYSDRVEWVAAVYTSEAVAVRAAEEHLRAARSLQVARAAWLSNAHRLRFESAAPVEESLGPAPCGEWVDDYTVVRVPLDRWVGKTEPL